MRGLLSMPGTGPIQRFGRFEVNLATGELRRDGVLIHLQARPFEVLRALIERPGDLVTRDELRQRLWGPDTFVEFDNGLNTAITKLRDALGDTAEDHRYIETLARRGYRFVAPVSSPNVPEARPADVLPAGQAAERNGLLARRPLVLGAFAVLAVAAVAVYAISAWRPRGAESGGGQPRIVVLPFQNLTGDPNQEFLSDGLTEELIAQLSRLAYGDLGVIARTSAMHYKQTRKRVAEIARELNARYVLEGSVRREGDRLRVTAQLIRSSDELHLWAETYQRDAREILAVEQEIVSAIAHAIHGRVVAEDSPGPGSERPGSQSPVDPAAHELYLKGRHLWNQRTAPSVRAAVEFFERAIDRQPRYAPAYAGLAEAYIILGAMAEMAQSESYSRARVAASTALEIDDALPEAHTALAAILGEYYWEFTDAEAHFKRALALSPSNTTALHWYSDHLMFMGRTAEAVRAAEAAQRLDPISPVVNVNLGMQLLRVGRFDEAAVRARQTFELFPDFLRAYVPLGLACTHQRKFSEAIDAFERFRALAGETPDALGLLGYAHARAGDHARAREALAALDRLAQTRHVPAYERAVIYAGLDDRDAAFEWLERAISAREWIVLLLNVDPIFEPIRSDARFTPLIAKVGLPR